MKARPSRAGKQAVLIAAGLAVLAGAARPSAAQSPPAPWKNIPVRATLANGIPWIYHKDAVSPTTVVGLFIGGGKSAVPAGLDGLAAISTRILLEIPDEGKVQDLMAQATRLSYVCHEDYSAVIVECLTEHLDEALRVAAKIIQDPLISGLRVGRAKDLMKAYAKMDEDDPAATGRNAVFGAFFGGRGYGSLLYGTEATVGAVDRKDVTAFVKRVMVKPNVFFCVETDLEAEAVRPVIEEAFDAIPGGTPAAIGRQDPALPETRDLAIDKDTEQTYVGRAYALPRAGLSDMARGTLLETLLGNGPGSRLWALRADERLAYDVDAELTWAKSAGVLIAFLRTDRTRAAEAAAALDRTLQALAAGGVAEDELRAAQAMARNRALRSSEAKAQRLRTIGLYEILGLGPEADAGMLAAVEAVGLEDLNTYLRETLDPGRALRVKVGPPAGEIVKEGPHVRSVRH